MSVLWPTSHTELGLPEPLQEHEVVSLSFDTPGPVSRPLKTPFGLSFAASSLSTATSFFAGSSFSAANADPGSVDGNVYYINAIPDDPDVRQNMEEVRAAVELTMSFFSSKAAESCDLKVKQGQLKQPGDNYEDTTNYSNYSIRVHEYVMKNSGWMSTTGSDNVNKTLTVAKSQMHAEILSTVLSGFGLDSSSYNAFEKILTSISDGINESKRQSVTQNKWVLITTYRYDNYAKKVFAGMRTIYFGVSQSMQDYKISKHKTGTDVNLQLQYRRDDYAFNMSQWPIFKDRVQTFVSDKGFPADPVDIPV